ncbi:fatty acid--CoA ligase [Moraxella nasibovis]|uniref:fatty acid--CoA ligase n=1 Tax=Moraxella nasibovis TaxID=2904120 RepID=UPI00240F86A9|nr:fatty acid--CoA ligase [Moraxella nasibovis]WFF37825.1 fatty acid--CoA ligase [Moraxella nasibovis]
MDYQDYQSAHEAYAYPLLIKQLLNRAKVASKDQKIHYADRLTYTYADFFKRINRLANVLKSLDLQAGDVVAVMDWDSHRYLESYFAVPMSQYILQTVNIRLSPDKVLYTLNHAKPKVLLLNAEFAPMIQDYHLDVPSVEKVIWLDDGAFDGAPNAIPDYMHSLCAGEYEALLAAASEDFDFPDFDENTIATTFYTSGTTGDPKGVFFSHRQLVLHTLGITTAFALNAEKQGLGYGDVYMPVTPLFHVHGWGVPYMSTMIGIEQIYPGRYVPEKLVDMIEQKGVTFTHGVPTILQMLLGEMAKRGRKFDGLKMIIGGSRLTEGLARTAVANGVEAFTAYGMSETCPVITMSTFNQKEVLSEDEDIIRRTKTGVPVALVDIQLWQGGERIDAQDEQSTGEIVVRAPWLTQSYFKNHDAGDELWQGGYLHTQDIAHINREGNLQVTDRLKDVIKSGGEWVSSLEIETILSLHPSVADIAVIGVPDEKWGERPMALIVKKPDCQETKAEDILALAEQAFERGMIPKYGIPSQVRFLEQLPKTSVGKLDKKVMRDMFAKGLFAE